MPTHFKGRWPDDIVPVNQPIWFYYEVDVEADILIRQVEVFQDGHVARNSIAIEERNGDVCPSLSDGPIMVIFDEYPFEKIMAVEFEEVWCRGVDTPFWFP